MLKTRTPGTAPHLRSQSPTNGLRRQIIKMVKISDQSDAQGGPTIIYDLRQRQVIQGDLSVSKTPDIRRISVKQLQDERVDRQVLQTSSSLFPKPCKTSTPYAKRREWRKAPEGRNQSPIRTKPSFLTPSPPKVSQGAPETGKRPRPCQGRERRLLKTKAIRLQNDSTGPHCQASDSSSPSEEKTVSKTSGEPCEVRGNAINSSAARGSRTMSPGKRADVQRRSTLFSASLELFRRRLKMNQNKLFSCNKVNPEEYVIRRDDDRNSPAKKPLVTHHVPSPPKSTSPRRVAPGRREGSTEDSIDARGTRFSYRLADVSDGDKRQLPLGLADIRGLPQVQTYVLEDNADDDQVRRRSFKEPAPLTAHNLDIHNMFMDEHRRRPQVDINGVAVDPRIWRWVEESNAESKIQRVVRFNVVSNANNQRLSVSDPNRKLSLSDPNRKLSLSDPNRKLSLSDSSRGMSSADRSRD